MDTTPQPLRFVNKREPILITRDRLPHWNQADCVQFVTFRLADSLPQSKLQEYRRNKQEWLGAHPKPWDEATEQEYEESFTAVMDRWTDAGYGKCLMRTKAVRDAVADAIMHFDGDRYTIHAYVIMPNHVHVLTSPMPGFPLDKTVQSWKRYSAHDINMLTCRTGSVWESRYFDRLIRSAGDYGAKLDYIIGNPANMPPDKFTLYVADSQANRITLEQIGRSSEAIDAMVGARR
jgi:REP element-mobilizing transposase RayT